VRFVFYHPLTALKSRGRVGLLTGIVASKLALASLACYLGATTAGLVGRRRRLSSSSAILVIPKARLVRA